MNETMTDRELLSLALKLSIQRKYKNLYSDYAIRNKDKVLKDISYELSKRRVHKGL